MRRQCRRHRHHRDDEHADQQEWRAAKVCGREAKHGAPSIPGRQGSGAIVYGRTAMTPSGWAGIIDSHMNMLKFLWKSGGSFPWRDAKEIRLGRWESSITDEWFRSHFIFASDVVNTWLSERIDVTNARILDFGCGDGIMDLGLAMRHEAKQVLGVDIHDAHKYLLQTAKAQLGINHLPSNLKFETVPPGSSLAKMRVDAAYSWSVFEHVAPTLLPTIFSDLYETLPEGGYFFLQIEPLYYSPFGAHLSGLLAEPWVHLLHSHDELVAQIENVEPEQMRQEQKNKTFDVCSFQDFKQYLMREFQLLNKIKIAELEILLTQAGFSIQKKFVNRLEIAPPPQLLKLYSEEDLTSNEIRLLLQKA